MSGVPNGVRGIPLVVPAAVIGGLLAGTVALGLAAGAVTARLALRASPASAMRAQEWPPASPAWWRVPATTRACWLDGRAPREARQ